MPDIKDFKEKWQRVELKLHITASAGWAKALSAVPTFVRGSSQPGLVLSLVMAGQVPRLSGLILVDVAHGMDSSVF